MSHDNGVSKLYDLKLQKLKEQKILSERMNDTLTRSGGLNESSHMTRKSLAAAIAVSRQPGELLFGFQVRIRILEKVVFLFVFRIL